MKGAIIYNGQNKNYCDPAKANYKVRIIFSTRPNPNRDINFHVHTQKS